MLTDATAMSEGNKAISKDCFERQLTFDTNLFDMTFCWFTVINLKDGHLAMDIRYPLEKKF